MRARLLACVACLAGCSLVSRAPPMEVRYFSPEPATSADADPPPPAGDPPPLQLGDLRAGANLRERIVYRKSPVEVGKYQSLRWTDDPVVYVRHSLSRALFARHRADQVLGGPAPSLDVDVLAFEVRQHDGAWSGRVQLHYRLRQASSVMAEGVITREQPAAATDFDGAVAAVGVAMDAATEKVAADVAARLVAKR